MRHGARGVEGVGLTSWAVSMQGRIGVVALKQHFLTRRGANWRRKGRLHFSIIFSRSSCFFTRFNSLSFHLTNRTEIKQAWSAPDDLREQFGVAQAVDAFRPDEFGG